MSEYTHNATLDGKPVQVAVGWNRRLGYFKFSVMDLDSDDLVFWNALAPNALSGDLDETVRMLAERGITLPDVMIKRLEKDKLDNAGSRRVGSF